MANSKTPSHQTFATQVPQVGPHSAREVLSAPLVQNRPIEFPISTVAAAGSTIADGGALSANNPFTNVTGADGTKGVLLDPSTPVGATVRVHNSAGSGLKVYPQSGGQINGGTASASVTVSANKPGAFTRMTTTLWSAVFS